MKSVLDIIACSETIIAPQANKLGTSKEQNSIDKYARSRVVAKRFKDGKVFNRGFGLVQIPPNQELNMDVNKCISSTYTT